MNSTLKIGAFAAALAFGTATSAMAQDDASKTTKHHAHHHMHMGKHEKMGHDKMAKGDSAVEKLNDQSLQQAKAGAAPSDSTPASSGSTAPASTGSMAPASTSTSTGH